MRLRIGLLAVVSIAIHFAGTTYAAVLPGMIDAILLPNNPTSADSLKLTMQGRICGGNLPYKANSYRVSMSQNNITVSIGEQVLNPVPLCPSSPRDEVDLGRLPAGDYTLTVIEPPGNINLGGPSVLNAPFTVTDARLAKLPPYVRLDYSGHWWDPNDSGWGLFIWHDALDNVLAAWFTYTPDGKPMWVVFQPTWQTDAITRAANLVQTSRLPGPTSPPPNPTTITVVGTASLDFSSFSIGTFDTGKLTYTFTGGATLVRNIKRFKP